MLRPTTWIATRPAFDLDDAATALDRWWGLRGELRDLPSERDRNVLVRPADGPAVVLKVANLAEDRAFLECQDEALARLAAARVPVQAVVPARDGREIIGLGDDAGEAPPFTRVLTYLDGRPLATVGDPSTALLTDLGRVLGRAAAALGAFDHPSVHREFQWDVLRVEAVVDGALPDIDDEGRRELLDRTLDRLRTRLFPAFDDLRRGTIHNDANDYNVLVDDAGARIAGLLDVGDMIHSVTAHEAAVAAAYAMLDRADPAAVAAAVIGGFHDSLPLDERECDAVPDLIAARLAASVAISARQARLDPDPYLRVSERPAWDLLARLEAGGRDEVARAIRATTGR